MAAAGRDTALRTLARALARSKKDIGCGAVRPVATSSVSSSHGAEAKSVAKEATKWFAHKNQPVWAPWSVTGQRGFASSASTDKGKEILEALEHTTGLELAEKEGAAKGIDIFTEGEAWLQAPFGTPEKPVVVTSSFSERIVGVTDPEDDSIVVWDFIREGEPPKQIIENGEYFVLKKIDDPEDHYKPHTWP